MANIKHSHNKSHKSVLSKHLCQDNDKKKKEFIFTFFPNENVLTLKQICVETAER